MKQNTFLKTACTDDLPSVDDLSSSIEQLGASSLGATPVKQPDLAVRPQGSSVYCCCC